MRNLADTNHEYVLVDLETVTILHPRYVRVITADLPEDLDDDEVVAYAEHHGVPIFADL